MNTAVCGKKSFNNSFWPSVAGLDTKQMYDHVVLFYCVLTDTFVIYCFGILLHFTLYEKFVLSLILMGYNHNLVTNVSMHAYYNY